MRKLILTTLVFSLLLIGCKPVRHNDSGVYPGLRFLGNNISYNETVHRHKVSSAFLDTVTARHYSNEIFHELIGLSKSKIASVLGQPDKVINKNKSQYILGPCPEGMNCRDMNLIIFFSDDEICEHAFFEQKLEIQVVPNEGIQRPIVPK